MSEGDVLILLNSDEDGQNGHAILILGGLLKSAVLGIVVHQVQFSRVAHFAYDVLATASPGIVAPMEMHLHEIVAISKSTIAYVRKPLSWIVVWLMQHN